MANHPTSSQKCSLISSYELAIMMSVLATDYEEIRCTEVSYNTCKPDQCTLNKKNNKLISFLLSFKQTSTKD